MFVCTCIIVNYFYHKEYNNRWYCTMIIEYLFNKRNEKEGAGINFLCFVLVFRQVKKTKNFAGKK